MTQFSAPASTVGVDLDAAKGHLLLVEPLSQEHGVQTVHGPADPIRANVVDLDTGEKFDDVLLFPRVLISQLRPRIGAKVLGRLGQGAAKKGQNAPWVLDDATADDTKKATAWVEQQAKTQFSAPATSAAPAGGGNGWGEDAPF